MKIHKYHASSTYFLLVPVYLETEFLKICRKPFCNFIFSPNACVSYTTQLNKSTGFPTSSVDYSVDQNKILLRFLSEIVLSTRRKQNTQHMAW